MSINNTVYINVGKAGQASGEGFHGGYNGGGRSSKNMLFASLSRQGSGGGATHMSNKSELLNILENSKSNILIVSGGGGFRYIGNSLLKDKVMYCYNCEESNEESTKTISTTCNEETPTSYCSKMGNGYARITLVSIDE